MSLVLKGAQDKSRLGVCIGGAFILDSVDKSTVVNTVSGGLEARYEGKYAFVHESVEFLGSRGGIQAIEGTLLYLSFPQIRCRAIGNDGAVELD